MGQIARVAVVWLGSAVCLFAQTSASVTNQLSQYRTVCEKELKKILDDGNAKLRSWPEDYIRDVTELRVKAQKSGDLDGVMAVDAELARFKESQTFPDKAIASSSEAIRAFQLVHRDRPRQLVLERDQKVIEFTGRYRDRLTALQSDLTKANKIADAMLVNAEIKRVAGSPAVTAAEFNLAEEDARKRKAAEAIAPPPVAPVQPVSPPSPGPVRPGTGTNVAARPSPPPVHPPEPAKPSSLASGFKMVERTAGLGTPLKSLPLNLSPQVRLPKVRVDISMDEKEPTDSSSGGSAYSSYSYRSGNTRLLFRANVRALSSTNEFENAKMVVQYFTKSLTSKGAGKIEPEQAWKISTPLPKITSQPMLLDCPSFQYWSSTSKYRNAYSSSNSKSGDDFYGAIVSVFGEDGKLLFQGASMNSLEKLGVSSP